MAEARRIMWMYTSRDVHKMLTQDGGWTPERYQHWLSATLLEALVKPEATQGVIESLLAKERPSI